MSSEQTDSKSKHQSVILLTPPGRPIEAEFTIPGSKSYTNRALITAAIANGPSLLRSASMSKDSEAMCEAIAKLGIQVCHQPDGLLVEGRGGSFVPFRGTIDIGPAGTTMRFLTALCSMIEGAEIVLRGSERMHARPIAELVDGLRQLGAEIEYLESKGCPPLRIRGKRLEGGIIEMAGGISSQFFSAIMLAAPLLTSSLTIQVRGEQTSRSYIDMTVDSLRQFGVQVENRDYRSYLIEAGQSVRSGNCNIEGDASGASYLWGLAAVSSGRVRVHNLNPSSAQGDIRFPSLLERMGCTATSGFDGGTGWIEVRAPKHQLTAINADMTLMPDTAQTLAVIASTARGESLLSGLHTLRIKETDRILALKTELEKCGIACRDTDSTLAVLGGKPHGARIATYDDHRMAMSFAVLGSTLPGLEIEEPAVVDKSFPEFWRYLDQCGIRQTGR
jgi:3-phosphoshikimate 1-carboxyvinyltransferase